jgi:hypothetical protein
MEIKVGTFNLYNLFSRFNFRAHVDELPPDKRDVTVTCESTRRATRSRRSATHCSRYKHCRGAPQVCPR